MDKLNEVLNKVLDLLKGVHVEGLVGGGLVIALFLSIAYGEKELSVNIASGLIGYLGRGKLRE